MLSTGRIRLAYLVLAAGCAAGPREEGANPSSAAARDVARDADPGAPAEEPAGLLALDRALALALERNPDLAASALDRRAADARRTQAALIPNPEIEVESEDIDWDLPGFRETETTVFLGIPVELGGKRRARIDAAESERSIAEWQYASKRLDVLAGTARAFAAVLGAQQALALAEESAGIAREVARAAKGRVDAGAAPPIEEAKARIALATAEIDARKARIALDVARTRLASLWGSAEPRFTEATGDLAADVRLPDLAELQARLDRSPDIERWEAEIVSRRAAVRVARSRAYPDVRVGGGYRWLAERDANTLVLGVSLPLPLLDRKQGEIAEAEALLDRAHAERRAVRIRAASDLARAHAALRAAIDEAASLRDVILPAARQSFDSVAQGYEAGKFGYLELLDAQKTLAEVRERHIEALVAREEARIDLERIAAGGKGGAP